MVTSHLRGWHAAKHGLIPLIMIIVAERISNYTGQDPGVPASPNSGDQVWENIASFKKTHDSRSSWSPLAETV